MSRPQVAVVVPTWNSAATLEWTLCSLRNQRDVNIGFLVADSGSEDGTLEICKKWGVETIYVPPGNIYVAINDGLRRLDSEWVTYLNSDDIVYPRSYARLVALGEREHASLVYGDSDLIDSEGRFLFTVKSSSTRRLPGMVRMSPIFGGRIGFLQPAAIYRRSAYEELGGFDERYPYTGDYEFFFRMVVTGRPVAKLERPGVAAFRLHIGQLSYRGRVHLEKELASHRMGVRPRPSLRDALDVLSWRIMNSPSYVSRMLKLRP